MIAVHARGRSAEAPVVVVRAAGAGFSVPVLYLYACIVPELGEKEMENAPQRGTVSQKVHREGNSGHMLLC